MSEGGVELEWSGSIAVRCCFGGLVLLGSFFFHGCFVESLWLAASQ